MSTIVRVSGTIQFTLFLVMMLNIITIATSCDALANTYTLIFSSLKPENGLKKHIRSVA